MDSLLNNCPSYNYPIKVLINYLTNYRIHTTRASHRTDELALFNKPHYREHQESKWVKLSLYVFKLHSDALVKGYGFTGIGFVIRDHKGKVFGAGLDRELGNVDGDCAESMTLRKAMEFSSQCGCRRIVVESDSSIVTN